MKWEGQRQSDNVEDRRADGGGGGMGPRIGGRGIGIGSIVIALAAGWIFGINPLTVLGILSGGGGPEVVTQQPQTGPAPKPPAQDKQAAFVATVLADTEDVWTAIFRAAGSQYQAPKLVLFRGATSTACGLGESAMGPFYCPGDRKVYLDMDFFDTLRSRLGAPGDFAQAYVVAHEIGHHVQNLLGITDKADAARRTRRANDMSVRVELQADCLAGVWAFHSQRGKGWLEQGDLEEAMNAATQIGDDTLQRKAQGRVVPESFTHGSAQQRVRWFQRGAQSGNPNQCNTLESREL